MGVIWLWVKTLGTFSGMITLQKSSILKANMGCSLGYDRGFDPQPFFVGFPDRLLRNVSMDVSCSIFIAETTTTAPSGSVFVVLAFEMNMLLRETHCS